MATRKVFRWEVLDKYLAANPYIRFSLSCGRSARGGREWQAVLFKETGPVVAKASNPERTPALEALLAQVVKEWEGT